MGADTLSNYSKAGEIRSQRLNHLLRMKLRGTEDIEIINQALSWGVTTVTAKDYLKVVLIQAAKTRKVSALRERKYD